MADLLGTHELGVARIKLGALRFGDRRHRELDPKNVARLVEIFELEGCDRQTPNHFVCAVISQEQLRAVLPAAGFGFDSNGLPPLLLLDAVECLYGLHRIVAAERVLEPHEHWWTVRLYCQSLPQGHRRALVEQYDNELSFTDGEILWNIRTNRRCGNHDLEKKWLARLTAEKRRRLAQLEKRDRIMEGFDRLLPYRGLWRAIRLGCLQRLLGLHCDEELEQYLIWIYACWSRFVPEGDGAWVDSATVEKLQLRAPASVRKDARAVEDLFEAGQIFKDVQDPTARGELQTRILAWQTPILTIFTLFEDIKYIEPCSAILKQLLPLRPYQTIQQAAREAMVPDTPLQIEVAEGRCKSYEPGEFTEGFHVHYVQLWLYCLRHFADMTSFKPRKEPGGKAPAPRESNPFYWQQLGFLSMKLGFCTDAARRLQQQDSAGMLARRFATRDGLSADIRVGDFLGSLFEGATDADNLARVRDPAYADHAAGLPSYDRYRVIRQIYFLPTIIPPPSLNPSPVIFMKHRFLSCFWGGYLESFTSLTVTDDPAATFGLANREQTPPVASSAPASQHDELEAARARHQEELETARARHQSELQGVRVSCRNELETARASHQRELETASASHQHELETTRAGHQQALEAATARHQQALETARVSHQQELEAATRHNQAAQASQGELEAARARHQKELEDAQASYQKELEATVLQHRKELDAAVARHVEHQEAQHQAARSRLQEELSAARADHQRAVDGATADASLVQDLQQKLQAQKDDFAKRDQEHGQQVEQQQQRCQDLVAQVAELRNVLSQSQQAHKDCASIIDGGKEELRRTQAELSDVQAEWNSAQVVAEEHRLSDEARLAVSQTECAKLAEDQKQARQTEEELRRVLADTIVERDSALRRISQLVVDAHTHVASVTAHVEQAAGNYVAQRELEYREAAEQHVTQVTDAATALVTQAQEQAQRTRQDWEELIAALLHSARCDTGPVEAEAHVRLADRPFVMICQSPGRLDQKYSFTAEYVMKHRDTFEGLLNDFWTRTQGHCEYEVETGGKLFCDSEFLNLLKAFEKTHYMKAQWNSIESPPRYFLPPQRDVAPARPRQASFSRSAVFDEALLLESNEGMDAESSGDHQLVVAGTPSGQRRQSSSDGVGTVELRKKHPVGPSSKKRRLEYDTNETT